MLKILRVFVLCVTDLEDTIFVSLFVLCMTDFDCVSIKFYCNNFNFNKIDTIVIVNDVSSHVVYIWDYIR